MHVDRQKYLLLVSAIAAGCGGRDQSPPAWAPPVIATDPEPAPTANSDPTFSDPSPAPTMAAPTHEGIPPMTAPTHEGIPPATAPMSAGMCRASNVQQPAATGCRDDVGKPGSCSTGRLAQACRRMQFHCNKCDSYKLHFKPRVAARALSCMRAQGPQQLQDGCQTYRCGDEALKSACPDSSARTACRSIAAQCGEPLSACTQMLSGMNAAGRSAVAACAARGCSYGLWSCIEGM